jgi:uncharacterized protein YndB with AHSA1/START domain
MPDLRSYKVTAHGDLEIKGTREFDAPRNMVWDAFTKPDLLKRWMLGPDGWILSVCDVDLRVGGTYRYVWYRVEENLSMGMGGSYLEIDKPKRLVTTEKFDQSWYPGGMVGTLDLIEKDGKTTILQTFRYDSQEARDGVLRSPMDEGMAASYNRLDGVLADLEAKGAGGKGNAK